MKKRLKIAFDSSQLHILENYLIDAYRGALLYAMEQNWEVVYRDCRFGPNYAKANYNQLHDLDVDGILFDYLNEKFVDQILSTGLPAVNIGGYSYDGKVASVHQDNHRIGELGAQHLMDCFFDHLAFFGTNNIVSLPRAQGFRETVLDAEKIYTEFNAQLTASVYNLYLDWQSVMSNLSEFKTWLKNLPKPVGIMCYHDALAYVTMHCCRELKINVPHEIAILGVQEFPMLPNSPLQSLSSIDHSARESGYASAKLLHQIIKNEATATAQVYIQPQGIIERSSTATKAVSHPVVKAAYQFIRDHFTQPITVDDIAQAANTSRATLNRHYPRIMKKTVAEEIRHCRLERAYTLLKDSRLSIKEIADVCGFSDAAHLSNSFLKRYQQRPADLRREV